MNRITQLFDIKYPIIQGGMIWQSGWRLASAVSNCGGLGLLGAGSMYPDILRENIRKCQAATDKPFGVNVPMLYPDIDQLMQIIVEEGVKIVFTSAGSPKKYTKDLQAEGIKVAHVVSSVKFAQKCEQAGVDAIVAEGFEAGGHNGREETTTLALIPNVRRNITLPLIAAGGIAVGSQIKAAMVLGADGVQIGSRFAATQESSSHENYKQEIVKAGEGDSILTLKELAPVRMLKTHFYDELLAVYQSGGGVEELKKVLGRARPKRGMFEGNLIEGELQVGQSSALIDEVLSVEEVFKKLIREFNEAPCPSLAAL